MTAVKSVSLHAFYDVYIHNIIICLSGLFSAVANPFKEYRNTLCILDICWNAERELLMKTGLSLIPVQL